LSEWSESVRYAVEREGYKIADAHFQGVELIHLPMDQRASRLADASATDAAETSDEEEHIQAVLAATNPLRAMERYRVLFKSIGADGLERLQRNPNDSIAVQAAWEVVIRINWLASTVR